MRSAPKKKRESGALKEVWQAHNELVDFVREIAPSQSPGSNVIITRTANGTLFRANESKAVESAAISTFRLVRVENDYLVCHAWDFTSEGSEEVVVAKDYEFRVTGWHGQTVRYRSELTGGVIDVSYSYSSTDGGVTRVATSAGITETQAIRTPFVNGRSVIVAVKLNTNTGVSGAEWIDLNTSGRSWAKIL